MSVGDLSARFKFVRNLGQTRSQVTPPPKIESFLINYQHVPRTLIHFQDETLNTTTFRFAQHLFDVSLFQHSDSVGFFFCFLPVGFTPSVTDRDVSCGF